MISRRVALAGVAGIAAAALAAQPRAAQGAGPEGAGRGRMPTLAFRTEVPAHPVDVILGRPTATSVTLSILAYRPLRATLRYGEESGALTSTLPARDCPAGEPVLLPLASLRPDTRYAYEVSFASAEGLAAAPVTGRFSTARPPGASFTFCVQADSHLDFGTDPETYTRSLREAVASRPDFFVDLGDTFMTDKRNHFREALPQYVAQRFYLGTIGRVAPVFLVLGNHDGEQPAHGRDGEAMAPWAVAQRRKYFPNPEPDAFYSGNATPHGATGLLQDYYAFTWGDALFVVLDPFWYSTGRGRDAGNWSRSLGRAQYDWLARTLAASGARFKFVFLHNLVGGETSENRGGAEAARLYEWGGQEPDGRRTFSTQRPGWPAPIHDLLVRNHVSIVFHGHDHFYARQERDGVVYQLVPQPGHQRPDNLASADEYGYRSGVRQGASGILRVTVSPRETLVEYVRAYAAADETPSRKTGAIGHSYRVAASVPAPEVPEQKK